MAGVTEKLRPQVGVGVMVMNGQKQVLLGLRRSAHGQGEWSFPGGHLEFGETLMAAARRETKEETDLVVTDLQLISVSDELRYIASEGRHYIVVGFKAGAYQGQIKITETQKWQEWSWFSLNKLPSPLFEGSEQMINNYLANQIY